MSEGAKRHDGRSPVPTLIAAMSPLFTSFRNWRSQTPSSAAAGFMVINAAMAQASSQTGRLANASGNMTTRYSGGASPPA